MRATALLATKAVEDASSAPTSTTMSSTPPIVVHAGQGASVQVVTNAGRHQTVTFNAATPVTPPVSESISTLREQIGALEDLLIGGRKDHIDIQGEIGVIKAMLNTIVDGIAKSLDSHPTASADEIRALAKEVVEATSKDGKINLDTLKSLFGFGMTQNLLASTVFEAIKRALETLV